MRVLLFAALALVAPAAPTFAQPGAYAGGGLHFPVKTDDWEHYDQGYRGVAGLQIAGDHFALVLQGGYVRFDARGARAADSGLPRGETRVLEAYLLPKFYLQRGVISAYFLGGGGPQWTTLETWTEAGDGTPGARVSERRFDWGLQYGFGVELDISDRWKIGLAPLFNAFPGFGRRDQRYASFVAYLML